MPVVDGGFSASAVPGPCEWPLDTTCVAGWDTYTPEQQARATTLAVFVLDALTGHQFAQCPVTVRPCGQTCGMPNSYMTWPVDSPAASSPSLWMTPYLLNGVWRNCGCGGGCDCSPVCKVQLNAPVAAVTEVKIDGLVLDPSAYRLVGPWLARTDGGECWPSCQDPSVPDTETGTFSVTYSPGRPLPAAGRIAAGVLAGEFVRACAGGSCVLPPQITSLTRQGVDVEFISPTDALTNGRTGIREVDLFIESVNPAALRQRSRVGSPDIRRHPAEY